MYKLLSKGKEQDSQLSKKQKDILKRKKKLSCHIPFREMRVIYIDLRSLLIRYWDIVTADTNTSQSQKYEPNLPLCDLDFEHLKG